jgi:hypothetical protein
MAEKNDLILSVLEDSIVPDWPQIPPDVSLLTDIDTIFTLDLNYHPRHLNG